MPGAVGGGHDRLRGDIGGHRAHQRTPGTGPLDGPMPSLELGRPAGLLAIDALRVHRPPRDARPRLGLDVDARHEGAPSRSG